MAIIPVFDDDPVLAPSQTGTVTAPSLVNEFGLETVLIDGYPIDAVVSEKHDFDLEVTEYPVEKGADITDHVRPKPLKISLECFVSDAPFGPIANHPTRVIGTPSSDIYDRLKALRDAPEQITVVTSLKSYDKMVLSKVSYPRNSGEAVGLRFTCEFTQVIIAQNLRVSIAIAATPKTQKLAAIQSQIDSGVPCYKVSIYSYGKGQLDAVQLEELGKTGIISSEEAAAETGYLGTDITAAVQSTDGVTFGFAYFIANQPSTLPATGSWVAFAGQGFTSQNAARAAAGLPQWNTGYNPYSISSVNPAFLAPQGGPVIDSKYISNIGSTPATQTPGGFNMAGINQAFSPAAASLPTGISGF